MSVVYRFAVILCLCLESVALSGEVTVTTVSSLKRVLEEVDHLLKDHPADSMAFLADWDEFLSSENGGNSPREVDTAEILNEIASRIRVGVLTARGAGDQNFRESAMEVTLAMYSGLLNSSPKMTNALTLNPTFNKGPFEFKAPTIQQKTSQDREVDSPHRVVHSESSFMVKFPRSPFKPEKDPSKTYPLFLVANHIAFVGNPLFSKMEEGSLKGIAAKALIDDELFIGSKPKVLLFGDNDLENIVAMKKAFEDRPEKLVLFHFPFNAQSPLAITPVARNQRSFLSSLEPASSKFLGPDEEFSLTSLWGLEDDFYPKEASEVDPADSGGEGALKKLKAQGTD